MLRSSLPLNVSSLWANDWRDATSSFACELYRVGLLLCSYFKGGWTSSLVDSFMTSKWSFHVLRQSTSEYAEDFRICPSGGLPCLLATVANRMLN